MLSHVVHATLLAALLVAGAPAPQAPESTLYSPAYSYETLRSTVDIPPSTSTFTSFEAPALSSSTSLASAPESSSSVAVAPTVHLVQVGTNGLTYTPNFINAAIGDHVVFEFHAMNHTATQSSFESPCFHLTDTDGVTPIGLDSGFVPVPANATVFPSWTLTVQVATPLWFYCRQSNHCEKGMGFGINPPATGNTINAFLAKAQGISSLPAWTETATAKWTGAGIAAAYSTGVSQVPANNDIARTFSAVGSILTPKATSTSSDASNLVAGTGLSVIAMLAVGWAL